MYVFLAAGLWTARPCVEPEQTTADRTPTPTPLPGESWRESERYL